MYANHLRSVIHCKLRDTCSSLYYSVSEACDDMLVHRLNLPFSQSLGMCVLAFF